MRHRMSSIPESISIPLGQPVFVHALRYTALFDQKPFAEALLIYTDNGSYKIMSPGEDHYGRGKSRGVVDIR